MKKLLIFVLLAFVCMEANAQLSGYFQQLNDGHIYFVLKNNGYYNVHVGWWAINDSRNEQKNGSFILGAGNQSIFGPSTIGWTWLKGERFIAVANGQQFNWNCSNTDPSVRNYNPSFGQSEASKYNGRKCSVIMNNGKYCNCSGCSVGNWDAFTCSRCGHKSNKHTR